MLSPAENLGHRRAVAVALVGVQVQLGEQVRSEDDVVALVVPAPLVHPGERGGEHHVLLALPAVAAEHLVAALPGERHRRVLPDDAEQQVQGGVFVALRDREVVGLQDGGPQGRVEQVGRPERQLAVEGADVLGQQPGVDVVLVGPFAGRSVQVRVAHRAGPDTALALGAAHLGGECGQGAGVESAREQGAQRYVGDHLLLHDRFEQLAHRVDGPLQRVGVLGDLQLPVPVLGEARPVDAHGAAGRDLPHTAEDRVARDLGHREDVPQPFGVQDGLEGGVGEDGLGLGTEEHTGRGLRVVQRLHAHPVPDEQQLLLVLVPDREGVDAFEPGGQRGTPLEVGPQDDLGVAARGEAVPQGDQLGAEFLEVVGLAAVGERGARARRLTRRHRLAAALQVDDGEAPVAQGDVVRDPDAFRVRAPAGHRVRHGPRDVPVHGAREVDPPCNTAHSKNS